MDKKKISIGLTIIVVSIFLSGVIIATSVGTSESSFTEDKVTYEFPESTYVNYSIQNTNSSDHWDNLDTPADIDIFCLLTGCNITGNVNVTNNFSVHNIYRGNLIPEYGNSEFTVNNQYLGNNSNRWFRGYFQNAYIYGLTVGTDISAGGGGISITDFDFGDFHEEVGDLTDNIYFDFSQKYIRGSTNLNITGYVNSTNITTHEIQHYGNITNPMNNTWGYFNNGSCIVIGDLSYVSEC